MKKPGLYHWPALASCFVLAATASALPNPVCSSRELNANNYHFHHIKRLTSSQSRRPPVGFLGFAEMGQRCPQNEPPPRLSGVI